MAGMESWLEMPREAGGSGWEKNPDFLSLPGPHLPPAPFIGKFSQKPVGMGSLGCVIYPPRC